MPSENISPALGPPMLGSMLTDTSNGNVVAGPELDADLLLAVVLLAA